MTTKTDAARLDDIRRSLFADDRASPRLTRSNIAFLLYLLDDATARANRWEAESDRHERACDDQRRINQTLDTTVDDLVAKLAEEQAKRITLKHIIRDMEYVQSKLATDPDWVDPLRYVAPELRVRDSHELF